MFKRVPSFAVCLVLLTGCGGDVPNESSYVLIRNMTAEPSTPALRAYFTDGDAQQNGIDCRELMGLANEAIEARQALGERHLVKYECVSLKEARERGFK